MEKKVINEYDDSWCDCVANEDEELCVKMAEDGMCPIMVKTRKREKELKKQIEQSEKEIKFK